MTSETHLRAVDPEDDSYQITSSDQAQRSPSGLPKFEGQDVEYTRLKLSAASDLEVNEGEEAMHIDDVVRLFVEGRVTRVDHVVDDKTGHLKRVHTVKVLDATRLAWDFNADHA